jgi:hypothetical protein
VECDGLLITFSFKMICLALGTWALFFRRPRATLPRYIEYTLYIYTTHLGTLLQEATGYLPQVH